MSGSRPAARAASAPAIAESPTRPSCPRKAARADTGLGIVGGDALEHREELDRALAEGRAAFARAGEVDDPRQGGGWVGGLGGFGFGSRAGFGCRASFAVAGVASVGVAVGLGFGFASLAGGFGRKGPHPIDPDQLRPGAIEQLPDELARGAFDRRAAPAS